MRATGPGGSSPDAGTLNSLQGRCCPPHVRVYIAGTLPDMAQERHMLHGLVMPQLRSFCEPRRVLCIAFDVRMGMQVRLPRPRAGLSRLPHILFGMAHGARAWYALHLCDRRTRQKQWR